MKQISILDYPELIGTAQFSAKLCPVAFAEAKECLTERTWDDLDYFDFFAFQIGDMVIALRKHRGNRTDWCYVTLQNYHGSNPIAFLADTLGVSEPDIAQLDETW